MLAKKAAAELLCLTENLGALKAALDVFPQNQ